MTKLKETTEPESATEVASHVDVLVRRLADMQSLCKRAHLILDEHWDDYTEDGYGPSSLLRHLERAAQGNEIKEITSFNDQLVKICDKQADKIAEMEKSCIKLNDSVECGRWIPLSPKPGESFAVQTTAGWCIAIFDAEKYCYLDSGEEITGDVLKWIRLPD